MYYDGPEVSEFSTLKNQLKTLKNTVENSHGEKNQLKTLKNTVENSHGEKNQLKTLMEKKIS